MKKYLIGIFAAALAGMPAQAADYVNAPYDWSGYYVGGHFGYQAGDEDWTLVDNPGDGESGSIGQVVTSHNVEGFLGGVQVGRNWQNGDRVHGVELDVSWADVNGASARTVGGEKPGPREWTTDTDWLATLGARTGRAYGRTLLYVEGGVALAHADYYHLGAYGGPSFPVQVGAERSFFGSGLRAGLFVGAGAEQAVTDKVSLKFEYNYVSTFLGNPKLYGTPSQPAEFDIDQGAHTLKVGINYRIN